jgi:hypothetical protein
MRYVCIFHRVTFLSLRVLNLTKTKFLCDLEQIVTQLPWILESPPVKQKGGTGSLKPLLMLAF